jgi:hypothetical protein
LVFVKVVRARDYCGIGEVDPSFEGLELLLEREELIVVEGG